MAKTELQAAISDLALSFRFEFVPFSKSRNAKPGAKISDRSLNWQVTILRADREILTTDYSAGIAHCPAYARLKVAPAFGPMTVEQAEAITFETERGVASTRMGMGGACIAPEAVDVIYSLAMDASVLDAGGFEAWASDYGYDTDSRSAEATYRACLEIALKLRAALGDEGLAKLRHAASDF